MYDNISAARFLGLLSFSVYKIRDYIKTYVVSWKKKKKRQPIIAIFTNELIRFVCVLRQLKFKKFWSNYARP